MSRVKTYKYNLYKILKERESDLLTLLSSKGLEKVSNEQQGDYTISFYLCAEPDLIDDIWWVSQYEEMIPEDQKLAIKNSSFFGAIVITSEQSCFALPLGKTHFYLREFADPDFGIALACRIADEKSVPIVNTRSFGGKKTKSIETFTADANLDIEDGESLEYMRANTIDKNTWGSSGSFGASAYLCIATPPSEIGSLIRLIEETLAQPPLFEPPRAIQVRSKDVRGELDIEVTRAITENVTPDSAIEVAAVQLHGIEFVFRDGQSYTLKGPHRAESDVLNNLDIQIIRDFASENNFQLSDHWQAIKIKHIDNAGNPKYTEKLRQTISYVTAKGNKFYFLKDGKWFEFSESYVRKLISSIEEIPIVPHSPSLDLSINSFETWRTANPTEPINYKEYWYNTSVLVRADNDFISYDRKYTRNEGYPTEPLDVYDPTTNTFMFVKRWGETTDFAYLIDQAITSIKLLHTNNEIEVNGNLLRCNHAQLILIRQGRRIEHLTDINSLIILQKLNAFKAECRRRNIGCNIRFQYEIN